jgi:enterochelin esterase-like enzyme
VSKTLGRRAFFGTLTLASTGRADAGTERFDVLDWKLAGDADLTRRAVVLVPRGIEPGRRVPVLVLLHGLGETSSETAGVRAWVDRYGLLTSHARLARPPVAPETARGDLSPERARQINDDLTARPFDGRFVVVCPYTPNVSRLPDPPRALDRLAAWMADVLLPEVRARTPADPSPERTGLDGCSMGGYVGLEIFLRRPAHFGAWGGVQSALGEKAAPRWADRLAEATKGSGPKHLHLETSRGDPFCAANVALSRELKQRGVAHDLVVLPGPHDQPWLREAGTLEMLLWHDRAFQGR